MSEHTPGPWRVEPKRKIHKCGAEFVWVSGIESDTRCWGRFARVCVRLSGMDEDDQDGICNARLIAAAPDMLAALEEVAHAYENGGMIEPIQKAIAAIAKARGAK